MQCSAIRWLQFACVMDSPSLFVNASGLQGKPSDSELARGSTAAIFIGWDGTIIFHHLYIPWTQKSTVKFALCTAS